MLALNRGAQRIGGTRPSIYRDPFGKDFWQHPFSRFTVDGDVLREILGNRLATDLLFERNGIDTAFGLHAGLRGCATDGWRAEPIVKIGKCAFVDAPDRQGNVSQLAGIGMTGTGNRDSWVTTGI